MRDTLFTSEEVAQGVAGLRKRKAAGPDGLTAEHLQHAGSSVLIWLRNILNCIVEMEEVPAVLKSGLIVPVYKRGGKGPAKVDSYRGVTLASVVAKLLEKLVLARMQFLLREANIPHMNQSAYRRQVSCADAIFATQE